MEKLNKFERESKIRMELENLDNWQARIQAIADKLNMPRSTVEAVYNRLLKQNRVKLWVQILTEEEAHVRFIQKQLEEKKAKERMAQ